ncbi:unnamed protein product [Rhizophagus irregularis]|nr:unnamed protein product [Rhizophagus irregularis]
MDLQLMSDAPASPFIRLLTTYKEGDNSFARPIVWLSSLSRGQQPKWRFEFLGEFSALNENEDYHQENIVRVDDAELENADLRNEEIKIRDPRKCLLYFKTLRETSSKITLFGLFHLEKIHAFMLKALKSDDLVTTCDPEWLAAFSKDFSLGGLQRKSVDDIEKELTFALKSNPCFIH